MVVNRKEEIFKLFRSQSKVKQDVFAKTQDVFSSVKRSLSAIADEYKKEADQVDSRVVVEYLENGKTAAHIKFGGDVLIFHQHTNVFSFPDNHWVMETPYVQEDESRAYCGVIHVYNFLADSFKYNRTNDLGFMICRIFVNREGAYFVEGVRELNFLYRQFGEEFIDDKAIESIIESAILFSMNFELQTPEFENVQMSSVGQMLELEQNIRMSTVKSLGFQFSSSSETLK